MVFIHKLTFVFFCFNQLFQPQLLFFCFFSQVTRLRLHWQIFVRNRNSFVFKGLLTKKNNFTKSTTFGIVSQRFILSFQQRWRSHSVTLKSILLNYHAGTSPRAGERSVGGREGQVILVPHKEKELAFQFSTIDWVSCLPSICNLYQTLYGRALIKPHTEIWCCDDAQQKKLVLWEAKPIWFYIYIYISMSAKLTLHFQITWQWFCNLTKLLFMIALKILIAHFLNFKKCTSHFEKFPCHFLNQDDFFHWKGKKSPHKTFSFHLLREWK